MGSKGPLIVFFMGIGGFVILGLMANWLLENNPVLKNQNSYRDTLLDEFPVERVNLSQSGDNYELELWVQRSEVPLSAETPGGGLPASFATIRRHFERSYPSRTPPQSLEVVVRPISTGFSCRRDDAVLFREAYALEEDRQTFKRQLQELLGSKSLFLRENARGGLTAEVVGDPDLDSIQRAAKRLAAYQGGGWQRIEIRVGRKRHRFDEKGERAR